VWPCGPESVEPDRQMTVDGVNRKVHNTGNNPVGRKGTALLPNAVDDLIDLKMTIRAKVISIP